MIKIRDKGIFGAMLKGFPQVKGGSAVRKRVEEDWEEVRP